MLDEYIEALKTDIEKIFGEKNKVEFCWVHSAEGIDDAHKIGQCNSATVLCSMDSCYICDDTQNEYMVIRDGNETIEKVNYELGLLIKPVFSLRIVSDDSDKVADLEDLLLAAYSEERKLIIKNDLDSICISVIKKEGSSVDRGIINTLVKKYYSTICLSTIDQGIVYNEKYHPAKVAFDPYLQFEVLEKYIAYNDLSKYYYKKLPYQLIEKTEGFTPSDEEKRNEENYLKTKELADSILKTSEILDSEHSNVFYAKKIVRIMVKNKIIMINDAIKLFDEDKKKNELQLNVYNRRLEEEQEERKEQQIENEFNEKKRINDENNRKFILDSIGDNEINRYIDSVVSSLRTLLGDEVTVYGGSTYMNYYKSIDENSMIYPVILVKYDCDFDSKIDYNSKCFKMYSSPDEEVRDYIFDYFNFLPLKMTVSINVYYDEGSQDRAELIKKQILDAYEKEETLYVNTSRNNDVSYLYNIKIENNINDSDSSCISINLGEQIVAYFNTKYEKDDIKLDPQKQKILLKKSKFYHELVPRMRNAINSMTTEFTRCFNGQKPSYDDKKKGEKFCNLKIAYNNKNNITKEQFDGGLPRIVQIYPDLYSYFNNGLVLDNVVSDMKEKCNRFNSSCLSIKEELDIPDKEIDSSAKLNFRSSDLIDQYLKILNENDFTILDSLFFESFERENAKKVKKKQDDELSHLDFGQIGKTYTKEVQQEYYPESTHIHYHEESSGGGFISNMLAVAAGNTISNHFEDKKRKRELEEERRKYEKERESREMSEKIERWNRESEEKREREERRKREQIEYKERMNRYIAEKEAYYRAEQVNRERERKGLTPLPLPPKPVYPH